MIRPAISRASARRSLSTNSRTLFCSHSVESHPGSLYHHTIPAASSSPAMAFPCSRVYCPRWTVEMLGSIGMRCPTACSRLRRHGQEVEAALGVADREVAGADHPDPRSDLRRELLERGPHQQVLERPLGEDVERSQVP